VKLYRFLEPGESFRAGDEQPWICGRTIEWRPISAGTEDEIVEDRHDGAMRRLVAEVPDDANIAAALIAAEIAARAAAVAAEWMPERVAKVRLDTWQSTCDWGCSDGDDYTAEKDDLLDAIEALLAEQGRLRGLVDEAHRLEFGPIKGQDGWWTTCVCGDEVPFASKDMPTYEEHVAARAAHVAVILDGGGA